MGSIHAFQFRRGLHDHGPRVFSRAAALKKRSKRRLAIVFDQSGILISQRRFMSGDVAKDRGASC
jgi:hypothetical protein